jgi:hypothetical protein
VPGVEISLRKEMILVNGPALDNLSRQISEARSRVKALRFGEKNRKGLEKKVFDTPADYLLNSTTCKF